MGKGIGTCEISKIFRKHRSSGGINWIQAEKKKGNIQGYLERVLIAELGNEHKEPQRYLILQKARYENYE